MKIVVIGLSVTSSWGNGHATTYRALLKALRRRGHEILFLECDQPWYAAHRDLPDPPFCRTLLFRETPDLAAHVEAIAEADCVIVGSFVPDGAAVCRWVLEHAQGFTAFYDIDTPVTLAKLDRGECAYLAPELIPRFDLLPLLHRRSDARPAGAGVWLRSALRRFIAQSIPSSTFPTGEYSRVGPRIPRDLQRGPPARARGASPQNGARPAAAALHRRGLACIPETVVWPKNSAHLQHLPPGEHRGFYNAQRYTLNLTREDMIRAGWSPSVRLFEAAACGTPDHQRPVGRAGGFLCPW